MFGIVDSKKAETETSTKDPLATQLFNRIKMLVEAGKEAQSRRDWAMGQETNRYGTRKKAEHDRNDEQRVYRGLIDVRRSASALPCLSPLSGSKTWKLEGGTSR